MENHLAILLRLSVLINQIVLYVHPIIYFYKNVMTATYGQRTFSYCAPKLWNGLPKSLKESETVTIFKKKLKTFLFRDYFNL